MSTAIDLRRTLDTAAAVAPLAGGDLRVFAFSRLNVAVELPWAQACDWVESRKRLATFVRAAKNLAAKRSMTIPWKKQTCRRYRFRCRTPLPVRASPARTSTRARTRSLPTLARGSAAPAPVEAGPPFRRQPPVRRQSTKTHAHVVEWWWAGGGKRVASELGTRCKQRAPRRKAQGGGGS